MQGRAVIVGIISGIIYGIVIRVMSEWSTIEGDGIYEIITYSFLITMPFAVGAISVYIAADKKHTTIKSQLYISFLTMLFFLLAMMVLMLEGFICIVLIAPVFIVASLAGGLIMGFVNNKYKSKAKGTLNSFVLIPLILSPLESIIPVSPETGMVETSIVIYAPPEKIFNELGSVKEIKKAELGFSFMHFVGLPAPLEASMSKKGVGAVRISKWEKGVTFKERITVWNAPWQLHYEFDIPKGSIPREALDRHVELGGDYFTLVKGGYDIERIGDNKSRLILRTYYKNTSHLKLFGGIWASYVFNDFHYSLLKLMKNRSEQLNKAYL